MNILKGWISTCTAKFYKYACKEQWYSITGIFPKIFIKFQ